jgi:hypothetical protein
MHEAFSLGRYFSTIGPLDHSATNRQLRYKPRSPSPSPPQRTVHLPAQDIRYTAPLQLGQLGSFVRRPSSRTSPRHTFACSIPAQLIEASDGLQGRSVPGHRHIRSLRGEHMPARQLSLCGEQNTFKVDGAVEDVWLGLVARGRLGGGSCLSVCFWVFAGKGGLGHIH